jgi:aspartate racemase
MKVIGLIGGMSWESTIPYYRTINETVKAHLGGLHSARLILYSIDFHEIALLQQAGNWQAAGDVMVDAARTLASAGAELLVICSNTMHQVAGRIEAEVNIKLCHIADPTASEISNAGYTVVGLLGTRFTMEQAFYRERLSARHGLTVLIPKPEDRDTVHRVIYEELCLGKIVTGSRIAYRRIIAELVAQGAQAIILGCTEIAMLVDQGDASVVLYDTTSIHARTAAEWALAENIKE